MGWEGGWWGGRVSGGGWWGGRVVGREGKWERVVGREEGLVGEGDWAGG